MKDTHIPYVCVVEYESCKTGRIQEVSKTSRWSLIYLHVFFNFQVGFKTFLLVDGQFVWSFNIHQLFHKYPLALL